MRMKYSFAACAILYIVENNIMKSLKNNSSATGDLAFFVFVFLKFVFSLITQVT